MKKRAFNSKELCLAALFTTITIVCAQIVIPLPFTPLPVSFGLVAVYLSGLLLSPKCAIASQLVYLLLGAVGLPVFGGFQGGIGRLLGPTGGCLIAYPVMAAVISFLLKNSGRNVPKRATYITAFVGVSCALVIEYTFATLWLSFTMGITLVEASLLTVVPFVIVDIAKLLFVVLGFVPLRERSHNLLELGGTQKVVNSEK